MHLLLVLFMGDFKIKEAPFFDPQALRIGTNGTLMVPDASEHVVFVFDVNGHLVKQIGRQGQGPGEFQHPTDVGVLKDSRFVVVDSGNSRIQFFTAEGNYDTSFQLSAHGLGRLQVLEDQTLLLTETNGFQFSLRMGGGDEDHRRLFYVHDLKGQQLRAFGDLIEHENPFLAIQLNQGPIAVFGSRIYSARTLENKVLAFEGDRVSTIQYPLTFVPEEPQAETKSTTNAKGETSFFMSVSMEPVCMGMCLGKPDHLLILRANGHPAPDSDGSSSTLIEVDLNGNVTRTFDGSYLARAVVASPDRRYAYVLHEADDWTITRIDL
ncbi:MAG: 6-bladed beta-propeller [Acidobacteria bacterium]|nr:6-bladed beta-propeller [Acidobacteriota bacterium]